MNHQTVHTLRLCFLVLVLGTLACDLGDVTALLGSSKPTIVIASPPSASQYHEGDDVAVQSNSTDAKGIAKVELVVDGVVVHTDSPPQPQPQFSVIQTWKATQGTHTILVRATNGANVTSDPSSILVSVSPSIALVPTAAPSASPSPTTEVTATVPTATPTSTLAAPSGPAPASSPAPSGPTAKPQPGCPGPPSIASFTASPSTITVGSPTTLNWGAVTNASSVSIDHGIGGVSTPGKKTESPTSTTTYKLTATGCGGTATSEITVTVNPKIPVVVQSEFNSTSVPPAAGKGQPVANCTGGTAVTGGGFVAGSGVFVYRSSNYSNAWGTLGENDTSQAHTLQAYALCASNLTGTVLQVVQAVQAQGNSTIGESSVKCPSGSIALSGGFAAGSPLQFVSSGPLPQNSGWQSSAVNNGTSAVTLYAYAECYDGAGASAAPTNKTISVSGNSSTGGAATCPSGTLLTGGGFLGDIGVIITSAYPSPPNAPVNWNVGATNTTAAPKNLQVIAICSKL